MQIPLNPSTPPKRPPLELCKIRLYSTGARGKVFTDHFYKALNHNFGVEILMRNNTAKMQSIKVGGCIYDDRGNPVVRWIGTKSIGGHSSNAYDFYVREDAFSKMKEGKYKVQFWLNDKKVQKEYFTVTYK